MANFIRAWILEELSKLFLTQFQEIKWERPMTTICLSISRQDSEMSNFKQKIV
jgi:hypothetical protein